MELLNAILGAQNGGAVEQIARKLNIDPETATAVIGQIAPALGDGLNKNVQSSSGLDGLLGALKSGNHQRYLEDPALAVQDEGVTEGNKILGHILGSKDVSRQLASRAAEQTGVSDSLVKQMLPMLATFAMGALSNKQSQAGQESGNPLADVLGSFLGGGNNSMVGDLLGMAGKLLKR